MRSPRTLSLLVLLLLMELLAGFSVAVGSSLLDATALQYGMFWLLLVSGVLGIAAALVLPGLNVPERGKRAGLLLAGALVAVIPALLVSRNGVSFLAGVVLLSVAYWRGTKVTEEPPVYEEVQRRFSYGFGLLFLGILWVIARGIIFQRPVWQMLAVVGIAYIVIGMVTLGVARLEHLREPGALQMVVLAVGIQLGFLAIAGLAALELFSLDIVGWVGHATQPLWDAIGQAAVAALSPLVALTQWMVGLLHPHAHAVHPVSPSSPAATAYGNGKRLHSHPTKSVWFTVLGLAVVLVILAAVAALIWRTLPRLQRRSPIRAYREERRSIWSAAALWEMLAAWLRSLLRRGRVAAGAALIVARHRVLGPDYPSDPVRRMYAQLLRRAQAAGVPRQPFVTPAEFQVSVAACWPAASADVAALTEAYVLRRYGEVSLDDVHVTELTRHWHHLRSVIRRPAIAPPREAEPKQSIAEPPSASPLAGLGALASMRAAARSRLSFRTLSRAAQAAGVRVLVGVLLVVAPIIVFILLITVIWHA